MQQSLRIMLECILKSRDPFLNGFSIRNKAEESEKKKMIVPVSIEKMISKGRGRKNTYIHTYIHMYIHICSSLRSANRTASFPKVLFILLIIILATCQYEFLMI